jgi:ubiquinol-cytochrome c reductase cytochrome b subunit
MYGRRNPLGVKRRTNKVYFHYYFSVKDFMGVIIFMIVFLAFTLKFGYYFIDAENFIPANPMVTPIHIQPE